jgi:maltose alpha-D-glucosyltransferase / alpha-amylase
MSSTSGASPPSSGATCSRPSGRSRTWHGGFSRAEHTVRPCLAEGTYGSQKVNVADERRDPDSLLNWTERRIRARKECREIGWGEFAVLRVNVPEVLAMRYTFQGASMLTLHNFSARRQAVAVDPKCPGGDVLMNVFDENHSRAEGGPHAIPLEPYGHRWYCVGAADTTLDRSEL